MSEARPLISVDTETTGTDARVHEVWELAAVRRDPNGTESEFSCQLSINLSQADPKALEIGGWDERYLPGLVVPKREAITNLIEFADDGVLAGLNISFDVNFLSRLIPVGLEAGWHYSPLDIKSFAAGALGAEPPWRSEELAVELGVDPNDFARHNALADCHYALAIYDAALKLLRT